MKKIPTLFQRDWDGDRRYVLDQVTPGCEWVLKGEGTPTRKYDGTCVMFDGARWWARREVKVGKAAPPEFQALETDSETGKMVGWEPIEQSAFARWHAEALGNKTVWTPGTYELFGRKINGDPESVAEGHILLAHDVADEFGNDTPRNFAGLAAWLHAHPYEGIVWHHPDGRMVKIKRRDFPRPQ